MENGLALLRLPARGKRERKSPGDTSEGIHRDIRIPIRYPDSKYPLPGQKKRSAPHQIPGLIFIYVTEGYLILDQNKDQHLKGKDTWFRIYHVTKGHPLHGQNKD